MLVVSLKLIDHDLGGAPGKSRGSDRITALVRHYQPAGGLQWGFCSTFGPNDPQVMSATSKKKQKNAAKRGVFQIVAGVGFEPTTSGL